MKKLTDSERHAKEVRESLIRAFTKAHQASGLGLETFRAKVAGEIGIAERTLRYWLERSKLPRGLSGPAVERWLEANL